MTPDMLDYLKDELRVTKLKYRGRGGFAEVYEGEKDEVLQAFKSSLDPLTAKLRDMAEQELELMKHKAVRGCDHIVQLRGVHWYLGHLITRWDLGEESLGDRLKAAAKNGQTGIPLNELRGYLLDAAAGIDVVNGMGIKHRDIKPDNLLLFLNGRVKVADFGLALFTGASTMSKTTSGTHGYVALEAYGQEDGQRGKLNATVDIYSLAATAIKLATGHDPFGGNLLEILEAQKAGKPMTKGLTPSQTSAVLAALHPDPSQRPFKTATEFVTAFLHIYPPLPSAKEQPKAQTPVAAVVASVKPADQRGVHTTPEPSQPSRRQWLGLTVGGAVAALGYSFWPPSRDRQEAVPPGVSSGASDNPAIPLRDGHGSTIQSQSAPTPLVTNSIGMSFATIPAGSFQMGSPEEETPRFIDETQHPVTISKPFRMSIHEVTQGQFRQVLHRNPSHFTSVPGMDTSKFPVDDTTWFDAIEFCNALSQLEGLSPCYELANPRRVDDGAIVSADVTWFDNGAGYRLPTEAEWEYACRARTTTPFHFGSQSNGKEANVNGNHPYGTTIKGLNLGRTTMVGSYEKNAFGLYDMHGNVLEWCWDWYGAGYYAQSPGQDPKGPISGSHHVVRGGSWYYYCTGSRSADRHRELDDVAWCDFYQTGFRVVCVSAPRT